MLDDTRYGAQSITQQAPSLGLALQARQHIKNNGEWTETIAPTTLSAINDKPFQSLKIVYECLNKLNSRSWQEALP